MCVDTFEIWTSFKIAFIVSIFVVVFLFSAAVHYDSEVTATANAKKVNLRNLSALHEREGAELMFSFLFCKCVLAI